MDYKISKKGAIELANYEAMSHQKYLDSVGIQTIGIGMTISDVPNIRELTWDYEMPSEECVRLFLKALKKYEHAVNQTLKVEVTQYEFDALVSITYNIGTGGMAKSSFMKRLNAGRPKQEVAAAFQMWNRGGGRVIKGLSNRREAESRVFLTGEYTNNGTVQLIQVNEHHKPVYKGREDISKYFD